MRYTLRSFVRKITCRVTFLCCIALLCLDSSLKAQSYDYATDISGQFAFGTSEFIDMAEDWNGFIWIGTYIGLFRFDGTQIRHYAHSREDSTLPHNTVYSILVDHDKREMWLGTAMGACRFDPASEETVNYQASFEEPHSLADNLVRNIYQDRQGDVWMGCYNHGLSRYRSETDDFANYYFNIPQYDTVQNSSLEINESRINSFQTITQDAENDSILWLGSLVGLMKFNKYSQKFLWIGMESRQTHPFFMQSVRTIHPYSDGLIIGTAGQAYDYQQNVNGKEKISQISHEGYDMNAVNNISVLDSNNIWISYFQGLVHYHISSKKTLNVSLNRPEIGQHRRIKLIDSHGRVWAQSDQNTAMYDPTKQITINHWMPDAIKREPLVIKEIESGKLSILTSDSRQLYQLDLRSAQWTTRTMHNPKIRWSEIGWRDMLQLDEKRRIMISDNAVFILDLTTRFLEEIAVPFNATGYFFSHGLIDRNHRLWLTSRKGGLLRIDLETRKADRYVQELNSPYSTSLYTWLSDLHEDKEGKIWVRLARSFAVYDPALDTFEVISHHRHPDRTFRYVRNFTASSDGELWISSEENGLGKVDISDPGKGIVYRLTEKEGLLSNHIRAARFDQNDVLWILSDLGISTYDLPSGELANYPWDRGVINANKLVILSNGNVALAGSDGMISLLDHATIKSTRVAPEPYITRVKVRDQVIYKGGNIRELQKLSIKNNRDNLSIEFSAMGFTNPKQFAYQLEGVDATWVETYNDRSSTYSNLKPGDYAFNVKARLDGGNWSEIHTLEIYLAPRWYETWLFRILTLISLVAIAILIYRSRIDNARKQERLKADFRNQLNEMEMQALRAQMNPHFLFNSINSIEHYIITNERDKAADYLNRFSRLMRLILQNSRSQKVILADELEAVRLYMDLESVRFKIPFDYAIEVSENINESDIEIPPMLIQPFVENAIWHGIQHKDSKGHISLKIDLVDEHLECIIDDDGIGRAAAGKYARTSKKMHKSVGLEITRARVDMLNRSNQENASFVIDDKFDSTGNAIGTRVILRFPV